MKKVLFTKEECEKIKQGIKTSLAGGKAIERGRKYEEFLILDREILDLVLEKIKVFGVHQLREGRILRYEEGCFFNLHTDTYDKHPDRYKTIIIQINVPISQTYIPLYDSRIFKSNSKVRDMKFDQ
jgi:hypothetical protein